MIVYLCLYCFYFQTLGIYGSLYNYDVIFKTGDQSEAGTTAEVTLKLFNSKGLQSKVRVAKTTFVPGSSKKLKFGIKQDLGPITKIYLLHKPVEKNDIWYLNEIQLCESGVAIFLRSCIFPIEKWLKNGRNTTNALEVQKQETRECGMNNIEEITKETADQNTWPWQATIKVLKHERPHHCSGSLIHKQWIITAAHCFKEDENPSSYHVTLGEHDLTKKEYTEQDFEVDEIILHPKHDNRHSLYNIALVRLADAAIINNRVKIICLPTDNNLVGSAEKCFSTGWEDRKHNNGPPNILKQTSFIPSNMTYCKNIWWKMSPHKNISDLSQKFICAKHQDEPYCHDDSGGPLACHGLINRFKLTGLDILEKQNCKNPRKYTMFVRVADHLDWIEGNIYARYISPNTVK